MCNAETGEYCKKLKYFIDFYSRYTITFQSNRLIHEIPNTHKYKQKTQKQKTQ